MFQCHQQRTDAAIREIHTAVVEINIKETSDEKMLESAASIALTFHSCQLVQHSASLVFLAGLEFNIRSNTSLTLSEVLSAIIAEHVYYEGFRRVMKARSGLDKIVMAAAPFRYFLLHRNRRDIAQSLEEQTVQLFIQRVTVDLKSPSQGSPRISIVGIPDHLGNRKTANLVRAVILASNRSLAKLIDNSKSAEAYDVANIAFIYAQYHRETWG
ncbi:hypothetical protein LTR08_008835 [Meristemomyces frigidus]|nr:hypothetical protein LTR08_008835 [Meristemomyces frigidus]